MTTTDESVTDESTEEAEATVDPPKEVESSEGEAEQKPDSNEGAKKALVAERKARKDAEKRLKELEADAANRGKPAEEQALETARREAREEVTAKADARIVRAEIKAEAAGKLKNPALALKLIDTSAIEVDDDGEVDSGAVSAAIADLLVEYPELGVSASKFSGSADQGAKGKAAKTAQITKDQLKQMTPEQIVAARKLGQLDTMLGVKS